MSEETTFRAALEELEQIVQAIENNTVDIDELVPRVDRAAELLAVCRERINATQLRVNEIIASISTERTE